MSSADSSNIRSLSIVAAREIDAACDRWERAWLSGRPQRLQDYLATVDASLKPALLRQLLLLEWEYLEQRGESLNLSEYFARFPTYCEIVQAATAEHSLTRQSLGGSLARSGLADNTQQFRVGEPICVRPAGAAVRLWKWTKRHPMTGTLILVLLLFGMVAALLGTWATSR